MIIINVHINSSTRVIFVNPTLIITSLKATFSYRPQNSIFYHWAMKVSKNLTIKRMLTQLWFIIVVFQFLLKSQASMCYKQLYCYRLLLYVTSCLWTEIRTVSNKSMIKCHRIVKCFKSGKFSHVTAEILLYEWEFRVFHATEYFLLAKHGAKFTLYEWEIGLLSLFEWQGDFTRATIFLLIATQFQIEIVLNSSLFPDVFYFPIFVYFFLLYSPPQQCLSTTIHKKYHHRTQKIPP